jgi:hypothetical protein
MLKRHIKAIGHARERLSEPLLTMLTIIMAALMFTSCRFTPPVCSRRKRSDSGSW